MAADNIDSRSKSVQELAIDGKEPLEKYIQKGSDSGNFKYFRSVYREMRQVAKQFFSLPMEDKQKYSRETSSGEGYGNDTVHLEHRILDWIDRLYLTVNPEDRRQLRFWPENPQPFREMLDEFAKKSQRIQEIVLKEMARSLGLDDNCFLDQHGERPIVTAQFNYYPPCPMPGKTLGLRPHADGSVLTILLQDKEVEGLQFLKDNQWFRVPIIPEALLVNVGDQAEIMSNGIFKSPIHRVVTNRERERISIADGLIDETRPRLYKTVKGYASFYTEYYQQGKRPIEAALI